MNEVFGDTSFFVALISLRDAHHDSADRLAKAYRGRIVTTQWVLVEIANFFAASTWRSTATQFLSSLLGDEDITIVPATPQSFHDGWDLYQRRTDKRWSLTDCISLNVMRERGLSEALSTDHHFEQAGFQILLK
jgi:predicted nucleic acid-binding protein